jgi:hypothetical protein
VNGILFEIDEVLFLLHFGPFLLLPEQRPKASELNLCYPICTNPHLISEVNQRFADLDCETFKYDAILVKLQSTLAPFFGAESGSALEACWKFREQST